MIATKGGITRSEGETWGRDASTVYADAIANVKALKDEGLIKAIGISDANVEEIAIAVEVLGPDGLVSVQNEFPEARRPESITDSAEAADLVLSSDELLLCSASASGGSR